MLCLRHNTAGQAEKQGESSLPPVLSHLVVPALPFTKSFMPFAASLPVGHCEMSESGQEEIQSDKTILGV